MDIVDRLRSWLNYDSNDYIEPAIADIGEAADEIERLRKALKQIASTTKIITFENDQVLAALHLLVLNHLKIARAALKEDE